METISTLQITLAYPLVQDTSNSSSPTAVQSITPPNPVPSNVPPHFIPTKMDRNTSASSVAGPASLAYQIISAFPAMHPYFTTKLTIPAWLHVPIPIITPTIFAYPA